MRLKERLILCYNRVAAEPWGQVAVGEEDVDASLCCRRFFALAKVNRRVEPAVAALLELGAEHVVVTRGSTGASLRSRDFAIDLPAPRVVAVDTAGAGDMFVGSLAASLANKQPLPQAMERAITLASFTVTRKGTSTSFPSREEVTRLSPFRH